MENKVYYGEYSLQHWIELILKNNITLPPYQRLFVWDEGKVGKLIQALKDKQFVPSVTIGAFKEGTLQQNLILDGQQRLTSILLAYLGIFPNKEYYKQSASDTMLNENDEVNEEEEKSDNIYEWTFKKLINDGKKTKELILSEIKKSNYKNLVLEFQISDDFLKNTFLGFSYLVPGAQTEHKQQKYYCTVFRSINIQGQSLSPQESRASLYYLDKNLEKYFNPDFTKSLSVGSNPKVDFVRFLSLLSQFHKDEGASKVAKGYKTRMEPYYAEYIYTVVNEETNSVFASFREIFTDKDYVSRFKLLEQTITELKIPKTYTSIIDLDVWLFGLIYLTVFKNTTFNVINGDKLRHEIVSKLTEFKNNRLHLKNPGALMFLRLRISASIDIYKHYSND